MCVFIYNILFHLYHNNNRNYALVILWSLGWNSLSINYSQPQSFELFIPKDASKSNFAFSNFLTPILSFFLNFLFHSYHFNSFFFFLPLLLPIFSFSLTQDKIWPTWKYLVYLLKLSLANRCSILCLINQCKLAIY